MLNPFLPILLYFQPRPNPSLKPLPDVVPSQRITTRAPLWVLVEVNITRLKGDIDKKCKLPKPNYEIQSLPSESSMVHRPKNKGKLPISNWRMDLLMD
jgi:hypothetical protein